MDLIDAIVYGESIMPIYCWITENGETMERYFPMMEVPEFMVLPDKRIAHRDYRAERHVGNVAECSERSRGWPMDPCVGSGVHASQGPELAKYLKERGCPTEVVDGDPIYTSAVHRKKALKIRGQHDRASFN